MPTYVYKFIDSGETIEVQQAFTDEPLTELAHPADGTVRKVKKIFTPVGVSFKGGGFYKTDSRPGSSSGSSSTTSSTTTTTSSDSGAASTPAPAPATPTPSSD
jgi:predicted nucleic acid-binding Zn ribbon protein